MSPHATDVTCSEHLTETALLKTFGITANAFLPSEAPLQLLPDEYYASWELLVHSLPGLIRDGTLRGEVQTLDVLSTDRLRSEAEWRRAYVVLAFLTQGYIWGGDAPAQVGDFLQRSVQKLTTPDSPSRTISAIPRGVQKA